MKDFLELTRPQKVKDIVGNATVIKKLKTALENDKGGFMIVGVSGIGKTLTMQLLVSELNMDVIWYDASNINTERLNKMDVSRRKNLWGKPRVIIIDNAKNFRDSTKLIKKLKDSKFPIVIICQDVYPLRFVSKACQIFKFNRPSKIQIRNFLIKNNIFKNTDNPQTKTKIEDLVSACQNDIRFLLINVGMRMTSAKTASEIKGVSDNSTIFDQTKIIFDKRKTMKERLSAFWYDPFLMPYMVHENIVGKTNTKSTSEALDYLSLADIYGSAGSAGKGSMFLTKYQGICLVAAIKSSGYRPPFPVYTKLLGKESTIRATNIDQSFRLDVMPMLFPMISKLITEREHKKVYDIFEEYGITKDDYYDHLKNHWLGSKITIKSADKSALTRYKPPKTNKVKVKESVA